MSTNNDMTFFQSHPDIVRSVRTHCLASLIFQLWDIGLTLGDEVEYIWSMPWSYKVKWLFLYLRHVNFATHLAYQLAMRYLTSGEAPVSTCRSFFLLGYTVIQLSNTCVEFILAMRAYALFNRSRHIALLIAALIGAEIAGVIVSASDMLSQVPFGTVCILVYMPMETLPYAALVPVTQTVLLGLILFRTTLAAHAGWGRTPLASLLIREGFAVYFVMIAIFAFSLVARFHEDDGVMALVLWGMAVMSTCGCRLLINMQRFGKKQRIPSPPVFSTEVDISTTLTR
ncbi:hypothetical protein HYDPIDRAFT_110510 [Hydnomerulius pinastri MD-312]|nr:hypothetical protein HYDPIDRAFT_110510 [Hydnomerulius pinastri MD-312]